MTNNRGQVSDSVEKARFDAVIIKALADLPGPERSGISMVSHKTYRAVAFAVEAAVRAEQPQRGHVMRCSCCSAHAGHSAAQCARCHRDYYGHPFTNPRCLPGLLHDAEVRVKTLESVWYGINRHSYETMLYEARAEVERLKKETT